MARRVLVTVAVCALAVSACGTRDMPAKRGEDPPAQVIFAGPKGIYLDTGEGIAAFDPDSRARMWAAEESLPSPSFNRFFLVEGSSLVTLDPKTGRKHTEMRVPAGLAPRVASFDGRAVALADESAADSPYLPIKRSSTRIVVARPDEQRYRVYDLDGNFEPEAFSTNERRLFLIEYLDLGEPPRYRVRVMRLDTGAMFPVGTLTKFAPSSMRGTGRVQAFSPTGDVLYTLYTKQPPNYAHQHPDHVHDKGMVHAFIHVLNLRQSWAHCVDLPMPFGMGEEPASMLAVSADGSRVYAGDGDRVAAVSTARLRVLELRRADIPSAIARPVVAPDGTLLIGSGSRVTALDRDTLEPAGSIDVTDEVRSLGIDPLGAELYVGTDGGISVVDLDRASNSLRVRAID